MYSPLEEGRSFWLPAVWGHISFAKVLCCIVYHCTVFYQTTRPSQTPVYTLHSKYASYWNASLYSGQAVMSPFSLRRSHAAIYCVRANLQARQFKYFLIITLKVPLIRVIENPEDDFYRC